MKTITHVPAKAADIEAILDIILQILSVLEAFFRVFGIEIDLGGLFGGGDAA